MFCRVPTLQMLQSVDRCRVPLGLEDKRIRPGSMTASTFYNKYLAPWHGRLNHRWSWSARYSRYGQWLQINFGGSSRVKGIATQGRQDSRQWVKKYTISRSVNTMRFYPYTEHRRIKVSRPRCR